jgi:hypothetical protein
MKRLSNAKLVLIFAVGALATTTVRGQVYSASWSTIDGGGGMSTGGSYALQGTIGQPDAGVMSGGAFTISGGFWAGIVIAESFPALSIRIGVANSVILSWPNPSTGYVLQQTANMTTAGGGWSDVTQTPTVNGTNNEVTLPATGRFCLFRLRRP